MNQAAGANPVFKFYYAATAVFLLLDYGLGINLRVAFLEPWAPWRAAYYAFCFGCLALISWRPALDAVVTTGESLITLAALILGTGGRVMTMSATAIDGGRVISVEEIVNFTIGGLAAWWGWRRGSERLRQQLGH